MNLALLTVYLSSVAAAGVALVLRIAVHDPQIAFAPALAALLLLCCAELARHRRHDALWLADPCVLVTIWIFGIYYGASNIVYFSADADRVEFSDFAAMTDLTLLAYAACFVMWRAYALPAAADLGRRIGRFLGGFEAPGRAEPRLIGWACVLFVLVSILARLFAISLGIYGYAQEEESSERWAEYAYVLRTLGSLGILALVAVSLAVFSRPHVGRPHLLMLALLILVEVAFGFLSGFKQIVVMPLLVVAACYYVVRRRVPVSILATAVGALLLAYFVVQPFRTMRFEDPGFDSYSPAYLVSGVLRATTEYQADSGSFLLETYQQILLRLNLTGVGAEGLVFSREVGLAKGDPDFLSGYVLSPLLAYVPKIIWPGKPEERIGGWYTQVVLGRTLDFGTSTAMGPLTYLYFGGGWVAIVLGFSVLGFLYRLVRDALLETRMDRMFVYVSILPVLVILEGGNLHTVIVTVLRLVPIFILARMLLFRRPRLTAPPAEVALSGRRIPAHARKESR